MPGAGHVRPERSPVRASSCPVPEEALEPLLLLGKKIEEKLGLVCTDKRRADIWRSVARTASARSESPLGVLLGLAGAPPEEELPVDFVADLTVGETFFFRERKALRMFSETALPEIAAGKGTAPIRIWSAGCSTGEEPYTLSMLLLNALPGMDPEQVSVLGTDINPFALQKARKGIFRRWSFRGMAPEEIRLFFNDLGDGSFSVRERYRRTTAFSLLNLAERPWRLWRDGGPPDAVFCRNVLIYFSPKKREEVLAGFHSLLPEGGWLAVAACETVPLQASGFSPVSSGGVTLYRKNGGTAPVFFSEPFRSSDFSSSGEGEEPVLSFEDFFSGGASAPEEEYPLFAGNPGGEEADGPGEPPAENAPDDSLEKARSLADRGFREDALEELRRVIGRDRTDPLPFYLLALIHQELGNEKEAAAALRNTLFLAPGFVMAHYTLGSAALRKSSAKEADRHFRNAADLLLRLPGDSPVPESGGLTAAHLLETVRELRSGTNNMTGADGK